MRYSNCLCDCLWIMCCCASADECWAETFLPLVVTLGEKTYAMCGEHQICVVYVETFFEASVKFPKPLVFY